MRLLIIRHAEPNYEKNVLTKKGYKEAEILAGFLKSEKIDYIYNSPLNRAVLTAEPTEKAKGIKSTTLDWLEEFVHVVKVENVEKSYIWDFFPSFYAKHPELRDENKWFDTDFMKEGNIKEYYDNVVSGLDALLCKHGYKRNENGYYDVVKPNNDTIALFCHFGVECVLLSHLINVSPIILLQGFCSAPTGVTTVYTEERENGVASFRISAFGDVSHLNIAKEPISTAARFKEVYSDKDFKIIDENYS